MKKIVIFIVLTMLVVSIAKAQTIQENQIFLSGTVTDINTGEPVYCDMSIRSEKGKKFRIFSDPKTGHFDLLVKGGLNYKFVLYEYNILRQTEEVFYTENKKYREEQKEFKVLRLDKGVTVYKKDIFNKNDANNVAELEKFLKQFKRIMRFHRTVQWDIYVSAFDSFADLKNPESQKLLDDRIAIINNKIGILKAFKSKVNIILA